jgi:SAM-dependent methyltransferase
VATQRREHEWEGRYRAGSTGWDRGAVSPALSHWLDAGLLRSGPVLVPGCGHGHEVLALARAGLQVTAVDIAPTPVASLRQTLTAAGAKAQVVQADILDWEPGQRFAAVYEQTFICALDPRDWPAYEVRLRRWLQPGGRVLALFMQTGRPGGPPYHCEVSEMRRLFAPEHWLWSLDAPLEVSHPTGMQEIGHVLALRGREGGP